MLKRFLSLLLILAMASIACLPTGGLTEAAADVPDFTGLNDPSLLPYVEGTLYQSLLDSLDSDEYFVENVSAVYISQEYLDELAYNSQSNIFFDYTLEELDAQFQGTKYVFTLGEGDETVVEPFDDYDNTFEKVIQNVSMGTGVILICVTVSAVTGGAGAPAASLIFAAAAKNGASFALSSGAISTIVTGIITGIQTGDFKYSLREGILAGSEGFKWGAISGSITGGATGLVTLKIATRGGLTMNQAAQIIKESKLSSGFVKQIHSMDEYQELLDMANKGGLAIQDMEKICLSTKYPLELVKLFRNTEEGSIYFKQAKLATATINGHTTLIRDFDKEFGSLKSFLEYKSELAENTVTNLERMKRGLAALDPKTGLEFELHHIGQKIDSPLAILTRNEHRQNGNFFKLHSKDIPEGVHSLISNAKWGAQKSSFWKSMAGYLAQQL